MKQLKNLGLTENESLIYNALVKHGSSTAGKISQFTGLHRRTVYDSIERLLEKGLISFINKNNRKYFSAASPNRLLEILKEKENSLQEILPLMLQEYNQTKEKQEFNFYNRFRRSLTKFRNCFYCSRNSYGG